METTKPIFILILCIALVGLYFPFTTIPIIGNGTTTVNNITWNNQTATINISQIVNMSTWTALYPSQAHATGTLLQTPYNQGLGHPLTNSTAFIAPGSYEGHFVMGTTDIPLIPDPDQSIATGQFGYSVDKNNANYSLIEMKGSYNDTSLWLRTQQKVKNNVSDSYYSSYNLVRSGHVWYFDNDTNFVSLLKSTDPQTQIQRGQLNLNNNRIRNSPDISLMWSAGAISGGNLTYNNTNIMIEQGSIEVRYNNIDFSLLCDCYFLNTTFPTQTVGTTFWIYGEYTNDNLVTLKLTTNKNDINGKTQTILYSLIQESSTELHYIDERFQNIDSNLKIRNLLYDVYHFNHANGAMLSNPDDNHIAITAGKFYYGLIPVITASRNTSASDTYELYYRNASLQYNRISNITILNNTQYDNNGILTTMTNNKYKNEWVYLEISTEPVTNSHFALVMGQNQFNTVAEAQAEQPPQNLPLGISNMGVLIGRFVIQKGLTSPVQVDSAFLVRFTPSTGTDHNLLSNLQGCNGVTECYHLSALQYNSFTYNGSTMYADTILPYTSTQSLNVTHLISSFIPPNPNTNNEFALESHTNGTNPTFVLGLFNEVRGSGQGAGIQAFSYPNTSILSGDRLGFMLFKGVKDGNRNSGSLTTGAGFLSYAKDNYDASNQGADLEIVVTPKNTSTRVTAAIFNQTLAGAGNAMVCVDANGAFYRGTLTSC